MIISFGSQWIVVENQTYIRFVLRFINILVEFYIIYVRDLGLKRPMSHFTNFGYSNFRAYLQLKSLKIF